MKVDFSKYYDCINPAYHEAITDTSRIQVFRGGAGAGKSHFIAQDEIYKQIFFPGSNLLVVRQTATSNRTSTFPLFKQVISEFGVNSLFHIRETDMTIRCKHNGNEIRFFGLDNIEKVKSITFSSGVLSRIWQEEANEIREDDCDQLNLRLRGLSKVPFQSRFSFNPVSALHWLKRRFFDTIDRRGQVKLFHTTYKDNEYLDAEYKNTLEDLKFTNKTFYDVYCKGEWGTFGNIIFTNYISKDCPYEEEDFDEVLIGQDFGFNHFNSIQKVGIKDGDLYSFGECHMQNHTNIEVIKHVRGIDFLTPQQKVNSDSAEPARIKEWQQEGFNAIGAKKGKDSVSRGIDYLKSVKWYIDPVKCPGLFNEVQGYSYKEDKYGNKTDEPVNYKDDAIAAVRYAVEELSLKTKPVFFA